MLRTEIRRAITIIIAITAMVMISSCEKYTFRPPEVDPDYAWSLKDDIQPVFNSSCISCHGGSIAPDLRAGNSYNALTKGSYVTLPAEESRLYKTIISPGHTPRTTEAEKLKILYWITQGAKNN